LHIHRPRILNEARVSSYIQAILRHEKKIFQEKTLKYVILENKDKLDKISIAKNPHNIANNSLIYACKSPLFINFSLI